MISILFQGYTGIVRMITYGKRRESAMGRQTTDMNLIVRFFRKPYRYSAVFSLFLAMAFIFTLLDAFVIPRAMQTVPQNDTPQLSSVTESPSIMNDAIPSTNAPDTPAKETQTVPVVTAVSYQDEHIQISIETLRVYDTDVYIADVIFHVTKTGIILRIKSQTCGRYGHLARRWLLTESYPLEKTRKYWAAQQTAIPEPQSGKPGNCNIFSSFQMAGRT